MPVHRPVAGLLLAVVGLTACANLPYYNESLDLFSRSQYDPEIRAIERRTPPPEASPVLSPPGGAAAIAPMADGAILMAAASTREAWDAYALALVGADTEGAENLTALPSRITPPMGFARAKRVIYGANRGPFRTGTMRTLR